MTFACTDCTRCGKCYDKNSICPACGNPIYLLDDACPACGEPITDEMRNVAKQAYIDKKRAEKEKILALAEAARKRRAAQAPQKVVYPWEQE